MKHRFAHGLLMLSLFLMPVCLISCLQKKHVDYPIMESCQMGNMSSHDVTLYFFAGGSPKTVYAQIFNQSSLVCVNKDAAEKEAKYIYSGVSVTLHPGQTSLFYYPKYQNDNPYASCLRVGGYSNRGFRFGGAQRNFVGDSVVASIAGQPDAVLEVKDYSQWETWYDETQFIYYHLWRIQ